MKTMYGEGTFVFSHYEAMWDTGVLKFYYEVKNKDSKYDFVEIWHLPDKTDIGHLSTKMIDSMLQSLHLIIGTSYYKAFCPKEILIQEYSLSQKQADFWNTVYTKGLGEFFYNNKLDFRDYISFPFDNQKDELGIESLSLEEKVLVLHGGGKDSVVTAEIVKKSNTPFDLFCLNPKDIQYAVAEKMDKKIHSITRQIDPQLLELNASKTVFNGHVPISTFYTFAAVLYALSGNYRYIAISSEKSSSYGNVEYLDEEINHQWSKSEEAENLFRSYIATYICSNLEYFSMLRQWYEIEVVEFFCSYPKYFEVFSSSNHNFALKNTSSARWEYDSPKTVFVFILLSAFLPKDTLIKIFGANLYEKEELVGIFRELLGLSGIKPFECVGTPEEVFVAMKKAQDRGEFSNDIVMDMFNKEISNYTEIAMDEMNKKVFSTYAADNIPQKFKNIL